MARVLQPDRAVEGPDNVEGLMGADSIKGLKHVTSIPSVSKVLCLRTEELLPVEETQDLARTQPPRPGLLCDEQ
jgi:hypothetical protein